MLRKFILIGLFALLNSIAYSQTTEFTYQGNLKTGTAPNQVPANGSYDFEFRLWDAETNGNQIGLQTRTGVSVDNGSFSVKLDFGGVFTGPNRYLAITTRPTGVGSYQPLSPRQQILGAPYAINAVQLGGLSALGFIQNTNTPQAANFNIGGNGVIGGQLTVQGSGIRFSDSTVQSTSAVQPSFSSAANNTVALPNYPESGGIAVLHLDLPAGAFLLIATVDIYNGANFFGQNNQREIVCDMLQGGDFLAYRTILGGLTRQTMTIHSYRNAGAGSVDVKCETEFAPNNGTTGVTVSFRRLTALRFPGGISG